MSIEKRKIDHLKICREENVSRGNSGFESIKLPYLALPEINFADVSTKTEFLGFEINMPIFISSMTGGVQEGEEINKKLAKVAQEKRIPLALGSGRIVLENRESAKSFQVKGLMPDVPLLANVGAVQLNYGWDIKKCNELVETLEADGLILHLNPLQEVLQQGGDTNFAGLIDKISEIVSLAKYPIIVKEVGSGIGKETALKLKDAGVKFIDVAGHGGTNWSLIEGLRNGEENLGELISEIGISTVDCLKECSSINDVNILASGGIKNGLDIAKALYLGAKMAGLAKPFLMAESPALFADKLKLELKIAMFAMGAKNIQQIYEKAKNN